MPTNQSTSDQHLSEKLGHEIFGYIIFSFLKSETFIEAEKETKKSYILYLDELRVKVSQDPIPLRR